VLVRVSDDHGVPPRLVATLGRIRFNGWVAPAAAGWVAVVPAVEGTTAAGRRGVVGVAETLAEASTATVALRVLDDRQLVLVAWQSGREVMRYVSDPSREPRADDDVLPDPFGTEGAAALAEACGRPEVGEALAELLAESLDPDEEIESERLSRVLHLLGLPAWLVSAWRLPREVWSGPRRRDLLRLRAVSLGRRWRPPPPVLDDPPHGDGADDPGMWF
jgi:hypothetical protein